MKYTFVTKEKKGDRFVDKLHGHYPLSEDD
jgi:hypothetical protein